MVEMLLRTKLLVPPRRPNLIPRPQLIERLDQGLEVGHTLTFVSAPAGFGKSTLVGEWVARLQSDPVKPNGNRIAWLSLDERDNDLAHFLSYLVAAISQADGTEESVRKGALAMLHSARPPPPEDVLTALINEVACIEDRIILVLDDYHLIDSPLIDDALTFFLNYAPPQLHLVIATRSDPNLPVARYRARGQLTELRAADLRFGPAEVSAFLNEAMGLALEPDQIRALESRTEGWIAGLQLAAISLQGREKRADFVSSFAGSHHLVVDYLVEEVLEQQPVNVQNFLLQTAILDRLSGPLCDAVTCQENGQATLEMLEGANLFIVALDHERQWYRYHHLFSDLLRRRLQQTQSDQIAQLHDNASKWYEQEGLWSEAIRHAFAAGHLERVADLVELAWRPMNMRYRAVTWLGWVKALPDEVVGSRPALSAGCGWASLDAGDLEAAERYFEDAERWLGTALNDDEFRSLTISVANGRAYLAQALGDVTGTIQYAQQASELLHEDEYFEHGLSDILSGFAYWASGDLETAYEAVAGAVEKMQKSGKLLFITSFTSYLVDIMATQGRLREAVKTYLRLLETAAEHGNLGAPEMAVPHLGLSELYLQQGDMEAARRHLQKSEAFGEQEWFAPWYRHWIVAHARVMAAQGDLDGVLKMLNGAERLYYRHPIPDVRPLKALIARVHLARGELTEAWQSLCAQSLSVDDDLSYLHEFEHITLARLLIAQCKNKRDDASIQDAMTLLNRLLQAAEKGARKASAIEILVLQALALAARGDTRLALTTLERAVIMAEPEGFVRVFVDEGAPVAHLLRELLARGVRMNYVRHLLSAFEPAESRQAETTIVQSDAALLVEPLSDRELEVLQLIAAGLTNRQIAERLYLSLNTVKAHTRNIYGKLDVHSRTQSVARAKALQLLPPT